MHLIKLFFLCLRAFGAGQAARAAARDIITHPVFWERALVKKFTGPKLSKLAAEIEQHRSDALVSVVLPVNNGQSKGVDRLLDSLEKQTYENFECIAVDSGSTDDTVEYLRSRGWTVLEIEPQSFNHAYSRNTGAASANGEYLLFVVDDVVFSNPNWMRTAVATLELTGADSFSSSQVIDENADAYASLLSAFLSHAQSGSPSLNVSRNNAFLRWCRRRLPLLPQFRSVAIDDTNHMVRQRTFASLQFDALTVEDIEFALRLTRSGGRAAYTNLVHVNHYHRYDQASLSKYCKRVYLDTAVMCNWGHPPYKYPNRESFLVSSCHALAMVNLAWRVFELEHRQQTKKKKYLNEKLARALVDQIAVELSKEVQFSGEMEDVHYKQAADFFEELFEGKPPSYTWYRRDFYKVFSFAFTLSVRNAFFVQHDKLARRLTLEEWDLVIRYLWCQMVMATVADPRCYEKMTIRYAFDEWKIADWR